MERHQELFPSELSAKVFLEWRVQQAVGHNCLTESLAEVVSQQEDDYQADQTKAELTPDGVFKFRRTQVTSCMRDPKEDLRHKYRLLSAHWQMLVTYWLANTSKRCVCTGTAVESQASLGVTEHWTLFVRFASASVP